MIRAFALSAALCVTAFAVAAQGALPRCGPAMEGQVSEDGCSCSFDRGGQLSGRPPGWRWACDLLRGPGFDAPVVIAGPPPPPLPPGLTYAPQMGASNAQQGAMRY